MKKVISKVLSLALAIMFIMSGIPSEAFNGYSVDAFAAENSFTENNFNVYESAIEPAASAVNWNKEDVEIDGKEIADVTLVGDYLVIETAGERTADPETGIIKNSAQTYLKNLKTGEIFELNATELFGYMSPFSVTVDEIDGNYVVNVRFDINFGALFYGSIVSYLTTDFKTYKKIFEFDDVSTMRNVYIFKCADTYIYTLGKYTDPKIFMKGHEGAQCGSKKIYYISKDLINWSEHYGPASELEESANSLFHYSMYATDSGVLFEISREIGTSAGQLIYDAQGLYYTDDFVNYAKITNEKLNSKTNYHLGSTVDGKTIIHTVEFEEGESYLDEEGYINYTYFYDNFIIWEFDEATKKLEEKYCIDTQIDSYTYHSGKSNYSNLIIEESDNRYFYNITPDASASFVVKYPFADLKMINGFRITEDEEYCNLLTYFMSDGNFYITANGGKNFYEVKLPEAFAEELRNNNDVNVFAYSADSEADAKLYVYSGGNIISCSYSQLKNSVKTTAISHSFNEGTVTKQPNCTENGDKLFKCECGYSYSEDIPALGHNWSSEWTIDKEATYTETGIKSKHCTRENCNAKNEETEIPKLKAEFTDSESAKIIKDLLVMVPGNTISQIISQAGKGAVIKDADGNAVSEDKLPGTGMLLVMHDGKTYPVVVLGDVEGDGKVSAADARLALRASVNLESYKENSPQYTASNVNAADKVTAADARLILRASVGLEKPIDWMK